MTCRLGRLAPLLFVLGCGSPSGGGGSGGAPGMGGAGGAGGSGSGSGGAAGVDAGVDRGADTGGTGGGREAATGGAGGADGGSDAGMDSRRDAADGGTSVVLAATPPMGWNSWNTFQCNLNETLIKQIADTIVSSGMQAAGYQYVNLD